MFLGEEILLMDLLKKSNGKSKMKILLVNKFYYIKGGCETYYFSLKKLLEEKNNKVIPFSMYHERNFYNEYENYFIKNIDYNQSTLLQKILGAFKIIYNLEAKRKIKKLIKDTRPDIAHLNNFNHQLSPSILSPLKKMKIPIIYTAHDLKLICPNYKMLNKNGLCEKCKGNRFYNCTINKCVKESILYSLINTFEAYIHYIFNSYKNIDIIITPSKFFKEKFVEFGYEEDKVRYIPNFINIEEYKPNYNFKNYYIYVGRLSEEKGIINLIKAAEKNKEYLLRIIGTGPIEGELKKYIEERNIQNIVFDGFKTGEELKALIRSARFLVIPSICYENNPMSVIESMALGKVVVGSNIGGIPELIKNDKLLFKHNDIDSMANIIREIFELTQEEIIKIGQQNRKFIEENYSKEVHYNKLMEIYEEVINKYEGVKK